MFESELILSPLNFFSLSADVHHYSGKKEHPLKKNHFLPEMSPFSENATFAKLALGWSEEGIYCTVYSDVTASETHFPNFHLGDSVELFIDTKDLKGTRFPTKYCHHFCFFPIPVEINEENVQAIEVTRFRGDETHPLAESSLLYVDCENLRRGYILKIFIPREALFGYDPSQNERLGFNYCINRLHRPPQYFATPGEDVAIEQHPTTWASLKLVR